jgi:hypothetical protein
MLALTWGIFRQGFCRSDDRHEGGFFVHATALSAALVALAKTTPWRKAYAAGFFVLMLCIAIPQATQGFGFRLADIWRPQLTLIEGYTIFDWNSAMAHLDSITAANVSQSPVEAYRSRLNGSRVMIFPWELAYAAQSNFELFPVYAMQNYAANTHYLDAESASRLSGANPPVRYVVFEWKSIDGRHPLVDMPCLWSALFSEYAPVEIGPRSALLERRTKSLPITYEPLSVSAYRPEQWVDIPQRESAVAVSIPLRPTFAGSVTLALYKVPAIYLEVETRAGGSRRFRVPPDVLSSPFVINSLPLNFEEAMTFWKGQPPPIQISRVRLAGDGLRDFSSSDWAFWTVKGMPPFIPAP